MDYLSLEVRQVFVPIVVGAWINTGDLATVHNSPIGCGVGFYESNQLASLAFGYCVGFFGTYNSIVLFLSAHVCSHSTILLYCLLTHTRSCVIVLTNNKYIGVYMQDRFQIVTSYTSGTGLIVYEVHQYHKASNRFYIVGDCSTSKKLIESRVELHNYKI